MHRSINVALDKKRISDVTSAVEIIPEGLRQSGTIKALVKRFQHHGDSTALLGNPDEHDWQLTYSELGAYIKSIGTALLADGVRKGDRVGLHAENSFEWVIVYLAVTSIGAIIVPIDIFLKKIELQSLCRAGEIDRLFISENYLEKIDGLAEGDISLQQIICIANRESEQKYEGAADNMHSFACLHERGVALLENGAVDFENTIVELDDPAAMIFMHDNVFAVLTHNGLMANACGEVMQYSENGQYLKPGERWLASLPFHHTYPVMLGFLVPFLTGGTVMVASKLKIKRLVSLLAEAKINYYSTVPLIAKGINTILETSKHALSELKFIICGGAALKRDVIESLDRKGLMLIQGYGLTEYSPVISSNSPAKNRFGSVGFAIPGVQVGILNPDAGGDGEIIAKGPSLMTGYYNLPEETAKVIDKDGWLHTGDIGRIDEDGFIYITGRLKHIIVNSGGKNIYPGEVEALLLKSALVEQANVSMRFNADGDEYSFAMIRPSIQKITAIERESGKRLSDSDIKKLINTQMQVLSENTAHYKIPGDFEITHDGIVPAEPEKRVIFTNAATGELKKRQMDLKGTSRLCGRLTQYICDNAAAMLSVEADDIDPSLNFLEYLDSIELTRLAEKLETELQIVINPVVLFDYKNIQDFSRYCAAEFMAALEHFFKVDTGAEAFKTASVYKAQTAIVTKTETAGDTPIAIVGASGRFPKSKNLDEFWQNLTAGNNLISEIPADRFDVNEFYGDPLTGNRMNTRYGGFIDDIDKFDPLFFNISPKEAALMDPQQRIFLEVVWEAIEDAGCRPSSLSGTKTGLFVGAATHDYEEICNTSVQGIDAYSSTGYSHSILANRISYILDINGPSESIDTACSGSLVAIHRAIRSIRTGECDMALVGGVNALLTPKLFISFSKAGMLSPDGQCKTFSKGANGYVRGEGAGAVLLKPLDQAIADGNHIYGLIKDSAVNHGGKSNSMTAPNPSAQAELLVSAYEKAGIPPETISYIEAHGTGTSLGDPVEISGLNKAFETLYNNAGVIPDKKNYCGLGSVKTNIGHLETGAGIAGLIKVLLSLKNKTIPATINFDELNPYISLENTPFYIADKTRPWTPLTDGNQNPVPRRAGVSSFGFGGSNAHVVLEEYAGHQHVSDEKQSLKQVIVLSAKNSERLKAYAKKLSLFIKNSADIPDVAGIAYTLQAGRDAMAERLSLVVSSMAELADKLNGFCNGDNGIENLFAGKAAKRTASNVRIMGSEISGRPEQLAELWVTGVDIDWGKLYPSGTPKLVSLPTYPFDKKRYWVTPSTENTVVEAGSKSAEDAPVYTGEAATDVDSPLLYSTPRWIASGINPVKDASSDNLLVFDINDHFTKLLGSDSKTDDNRGIVLVLPGQKFQELDNNRYTIHPGKASDYLALFDSLAKKNALPQRILHLWAHESSFNIGIPLSNQLDKSIYSLFHVSQQLIRLKAGKSKILFLYRDGNESLHPHYGACACFARTLSKESPDINLKVIRINAAADSFDLAGTVTNEFGQDNDHSEIMYTDDQRLIKKQAEIPSEDQREKLPLKKDGVYLITGGLGGLGLIFANYLAEKCQPALILTGRSPLNKAMQEKMSAIEFFGAKVDYIQADISTSSGAAKLVREIKSRYGNLNGVVHSAGVLKDGIIAQKKPEQFKGVVAPKVPGTFYLDKAIGEEALDFFVMFSSVAAIVGNPGQADYAYGNSYMDHFAETRNDLVKNHRRSGRTVSINWPLWREGGMTVGSRNLKLMKARLGFDLLDRKNGIRAFEKALTAGLDSICVAEGDHDMLRQTLGVTEDKKDVETIELKIMEIKRVETGSTGSELKNLLADLLEMDSTTIDEAEEFSEYGVDSILTMRLIEKINTRWGLELESDDINDNPSIELLAQVVAGLTGGDDVVETTAIGSAGDIAETLHEMLAGLLEMNNGGIEKEIEFGDYGVDSIMTMRLVEQINTKWDIEISSEEISENPTIHLLANYLGKECLNDPAEIVELQPVVRVQRTERQVNDAPDSYLKIPYVEALDETEIDALLIKMSSDSPEAAGNDMAELAVNSLSEEAIDRMLKKQLVTKAWYYNLQ